MSVIGDDLTLIKNRIYLTLHQKNIISQIKPELCLWQVSTNWNNIDALITSNMKGKELPKK
jgi:hypothetical protein